MSASAGKTATWGEVLGGEIAVRLLGAHELVEAVPKRRDGFVFAGHFENLFEFAVEPVCG